MNHRNLTLLALAQLAPHCMGCRIANVGQVVSAHSNQGRDGKGASIKASDAAIAFLCDVCHYAVDAGRQDREVAVTFWEAAHRATMRWLIESEHLVVCEATIARLPALKAKPKAKIRSNSKLKSAGFPPADKRPKLQGGGRIASRRMGS